jgi:hypothetical protein
MKKTFAMCFLFDARQSYVFVVRFLWGIVKLFSNVCLPKPQIQLPLQTNSSHFKFFYSIDTISDTL